MSSRAADPSRLVPSRSDQRFVELAVEDAEGRVVVAGDLGPADAIAPEELGRRRFGSENAHFSLSRVCRIGVMTGVSWGR